VNIALGLFTMIGGLYFGVRAVRAWSSPVFSDEPQAWWPYSPKRWPNMVRSMPLALGGFACLLVAYSLGHVVPRIRIIYSPIGLLGFVLSVSSMIVAFFGAPRVLMPRRY